MAQMDISLPDGLQAWAESRVAEGGFNSIGEYVVDLMRRDQEYAEKLAALQAAIDKGRKSGISKRTIDDIIADMGKRAA